MERAVENNENLETFKLESFHLSKKVPIKVGQFELSNFSFIATAFSN